MTDATDHHGAIDFFTRGSGDVRLQNRLRINGTGGSIVASGPLIANAGLSFPPTKGHLALSTAAFVPEQGGYGYINRGLRLLKDGLAGGGEQR